MKTTNFLGYSRRRVAATVLAIVTVFFLLEPRHVETCRKHVHCFRSHRARYDRVAVSLLYLDGEILRRFFPCISVFRQLHRPEHLPKLALPGGVDDHPAAPGGLRNKDEVPALDHRQLHGRRELRGREAQRAVGGGQGRSSSCTSERSVSRGAGRRVPMPWRGWAPVSAALVKKEPRLSRGGSSTAVTALMRRG